MTPFRGLIAAAHTPLTADGELNLSVVPDLAGLLTEAGIAGVFVAGTTGESLSLSVGERKDLLAAWLEAAAGTGLRVIAQVGHTCRAEAAELAGHAATVGAAAVAAMAPVFFRPESVEDLIEFFVPVAAAADGLPFYFYDIPRLTGVELPTDEFLARGSERLPNLAGVKYTRSDLETFRRCLALENGRFDMLFGTDEMLLSGLVLGARGAVGSTYNYAAPVYERVIAAFEQGDLASARTAQQQSVRLVEILMRYGVLRAGKAVMGLLGIDCGPPRSPIRPLTGEELTALYASLAADPEVSGIFSRPLRPPTGEKL